VARALVFGFATAIVATQFLAWNQRRTGTGLGPRWRPDEPFWHHAGDGLTAIGRWLLPDGAPGAVAVGAGALLFVVAVLALVRAWSEREANVRGETTEDQAVESSTRIGEAPVLAIFVIAYFAYMVWARTTSGFDPLNSRLMLPLFLPGVLLALALLDRYALRQTSKVARNVVLALPLLVFVPIAVDGLDELRTTHDVGNEYGNAAVDEFLASPVWNELPDDCAVLANDPWLLWLRGVEAQLSPERVRELAIPISMELDELPALADTTDLCLVWMDTGSTVFHTPDELRAVVDLDEVATDGFTTIYRVTS
jgi:hypothetical protein